MISNNKYVLRFIIKVFRICPVMKQDFYKICYTLDMLSFQLKYWSPTTPGYFAFFTHGIAHCKDDFTLINWSSCFAVYTAFASESCLYKWFIC